MAMYSIRSERAFCERLNYDLLFKWFLDLAIDAKAFDATTFSTNRQRLLDYEIADQFFAAVVAQAKLRRHISSDHFFVDVIRPGIRGCSVPWKRGWSYGTSGASPTLASGIRARSPGISDRVTRSIAPSLTSAWRRRIRPNKTMSASAARSSGVSYRACNRPKPRTYAADRRSRMTHGTRVSNVR